MWVVYLAERDFAVIQSFDGAQGNAVLHFLVGTEGVWLTVLLLDHNTSSTKPSGKKPVFIIYIGWTLTPPQPSLVVKKTPYLLYILVGT